MEWVKNLFGRTVGLDTAPLIYFIERHPLYFPLVQPFFEAVEHGDIQVVTSTLTLTEVLVHPYRHNNQMLAREYAEILLRARHLRTHSVSPEIADEAARLRALHGIRTPDAIQLATGYLEGADAFVTNDDGLGNASTLRVIVLKHLLP